MLSSEEFTIAFLSSRKLPSGTAHSISQTSLPTICETTGDDSWIPFFKVAKIKGTELLMDIPLNVLVDVSQDLCSVRKICTIGLPRGGVGTKNLPPSPVKDCKRRGKAPSLKIYW